MGRKGYSAEQKERKMTIVEACRRAGINLYESLDVADLSYPTYKKWLESGQFDTSDSDEIYDLKSQIRELKYKVIRREDKVKRLTLQMQFLSEENERLKGVVKNLKSKVLDFVNSL